MFYQGAILSQRIFANALIQAKYRVLGGRGAARTLLLSPGEFKLTHYRRSFLDRGFPVPQVDLENG
jgi:hypothetical protein